MTLEAICPYLKNKENKEKLNCPKYCIYILKAKHNPGINGKKESGKREKKMFVTSSFVFTISPL